jgi:hypothetical protein
MPSRVAPKNMPPSGRKAEVCTKEVRRALKTPEKGRWATSFEPDRMFPVVNEVANDQVRRRRQPEGKTGNSIAMEKGKKTFGRSSRVGQ